VGGRGDDVIVSADGELDYVDCGAGDGDRAVVDRFDRVVRCESVLTS